MKCIFRQGGRWIRTLYAVGALGDGACDLLVQRFQREFGGGVDEDNFMPVGWGEREEDGDG